MEQQFPQITILMLSANPNDLARLRLDHELREIEEGLKGRSRLRDSFQLIPKVAVRPRDVQRAMLDHTSQIVHFSGHGEGDAGLALEDDAGKVKFVDTTALAELFKLFKPQCVVLNACYSQVQAEAIAQYQQCFKIAREIGDRRGEGIALVNLGHTQLTLGLYEEAAPNLKASLAIFKKIGFRRGEAEALLRWAELHDRTAQPDVAREACEQALALAIELGIPLVEECRASKVKLEENL